MFSCFNSSILKGVNGELGVEDVLLTRVGTETRALSIVLKFAHFSSYYLYFQLGSGHLLSVLKVHYSADGF